MACVNGRSDPDLWDKSKKQAISKLGGRFSARAMQLAGKLYRDAGGTYCGRRTKAQRSLEKWTREDWTTADDKPARRKVDGKVVYDRYLPRAAWKKLTKAQRIATRRKKRKAKAQFVPNTAKAAKAGKAARRENMNYLERYRELSFIRSQIPWDSLTESSSSKFIDLGSMKEKDWRKSSGAVADAASKFFVANPSETVFYVRDPKGLLSTSKKNTPFDVSGDLEKRLSGGGVPNYGAFGFDNADGEIYADGPGPLGGEWDYAVVRALDGGKNGALDRDPPKVTLEPVQGKTGNGWRLTISRAYQPYLDAGMKAAEKKAAELASKGVFPSGPYGAAPKELRAKYLRKAESRSPDIDRIKEIAGIRGRW